MEREKFHGLKLFLKVFGTLALIGILTGSMLLGIFLHYVKTDIMDTGKASLNLDDIPVNLTSTVYYMDKETGEYVAWFDLKSTENRVWVDYEDIPLKFEQAFVSIEDERFYTHKGVDWKRTVGAALSMVTGGKTYGGSTITQQLIKNLTGDNEVTIKRKLTEICRALVLEQNYSKREIIEWYLNYIYFGRSQYGIGAASEYYLGKEPRELTVAEMCAIAAITNNPSLYDPYVFPENNQHRRELILGKMLELGYLNETQYAEEMAREVVFAETHSTKSTTSVYPYYVDAVIEDVIAYLQESRGMTYAQAEFMAYHGGYQIYTCVDMDIQVIMDRYYQDPSNLPKTRDGKGLQSSMTVIDPYTGNIVGMVGGVGPKTTARGLNWASGDLGRRPPGSSFKPIGVYAPAIDMGLITPDTRFLDAAGVKLEGTDWYPKNSSRKNYGVVTTRRGITSSLNTVAAQVMDMLTPSISYQFLTTKLHMNLEGGDMDYAPLALGQLAYGSTTREMASAYTIFPTGGMYRQGRTFSKILDAEGNLVIENTPVTESAISTKTAYWVTDMLEDAVDYGTGTAAKLRGMHCAGKTGTSTDSKDLWFCGYTPYYVASVWTGYSKPASIHASKNPAAVIWNQVMTEIHKGLEDKKWAKPDDVALEPVPGYTGSYQDPEEPEAPPGQPPAAEPPSSSPPAVEPSVPPAVEEPGAPPVEEPPAPPVAVPPLEPTKEGPGNAQEEPPPIIFEPSATDGSESDAPEEAETAQ